MCETMRNRMTSQRGSLEPWASPTKRFSGIYGLQIEGLTLQEKKELLDCCIRKRRLEIRTITQHYSFDLLHRFPKEFSSPWFQAVLYCHRCPEYFITSNNVKEAIAELEITNHQVFVLLYQE